MVGRPLRFLRDILEMLGYSSAAVEQSKGAAMRTIRAFVIAFLTFLSCTTGTFAQVYFPLSIGDWWDYMTHVPGGEIETWICRITGDTVVGGQRYAVQNASPLGVRFLRQQANRVFGYDEADGREYVMLDFSSQAADTLCIRNGGKRVIIALGNMRFMQFDSVSYPRERTWTVRDSVGIVGISMGTLYDELLRAEISGKVVVLDANPTDGVIPTTFLVCQNYPNPFNPSTTIRYGLTHHSHVSLVVFNTLGQRVATLWNGEQEAGYHEVKFDATNIPSGVYFYRTQAEDPSIGSQRHLVQTRKLLIVR
jgi:hypothetical protein